MGFINFICVFSPLQHFVPSYQQQRSRSSTQYLGPPAFWSYVETPRLTEEELRLDEMTSIVELFPKARRLSFDLRTLLQYVEKGHASPDDAGMNLEEFGRQLDVLDSLVGQERPTQRQDWRR